MITHKMNPLNEEEVLKSRKEHGSNMLTPPKQTSFLKELWANFRGDALIRILTVALVVTLVFALLGWGDWLEAVGIAIAVVLATTVSTYSEYSNNKLFQKLQDEYSKIICRVFRRKGGQTKISDIKIDEIVVGDYILLQAGDKISADGVIVDGEIKVNQASLNGESEEAEKTAAAQDYAFSPDEVDFLDEHKVYRGSVVTSGEAVMLVKCVGDTSQFGKLAKELGEEDDRESPLKLKLGKLADNISKFGYIGGALIAVAFMINCMFLNPSIAPEATTYFSMANWQEIVMDVVHSVTLAIVIIVVADDDRAGIRAQYEKAIERQHPDPKDRRCGDGRKPQHPVLRQDRHHHQGAAAGRQLLFLRGPGVWGLRFHTGQAARDAADQH